MNVIISALVLSPLAAAPAERVEFVRDVRPIFENHCYDCHDDETGYWVCWLDAFRVLASDQGWVESAVLTPWSEKPHFDPRTPSA